MKHPRDWSQAAWWLAGAGLLVLLVAANQIEIGAPSKPVQDQLVRLAPAAGAVVALGSLLVTAVSAMAVWRRQKRQATVEAWTNWSDNTVDARRCLSSHLGSGKISTDQARALADDDRPLVDKNGNPLDADARMEVLENLVTVLNGLERMAAGAELGVYDSRMLRKLGATIIVRTHLRFQPYIDRRRSTEDLDRRQRRAYVAFDRQVTELKRYDLDRERLRRAGRVTP